MLKKLLERRNDPKLVVKTDFDLRQDLYYQFLGLMLPVSQVFHA